MRISEKGINGIKGFEGLRLKPYRCPAGKWTVGYGHTKTTRPFKAITEERAEELLRQDLAEFEAYVNSLDVAKTQGQFDALVSFCFNNGRAALGSSTLLKRIRRGDAEELIRKEFERWKYIRKGKEMVESKGLVKRRKWEADTFFS